MQLHKPSPHTPTPLACAQSTASAASPSPAATAATPITSSNSSAAGPVGWLEQRVQLPRGNYTTRRDVLKLLPLGGAVSCLAVAGSRLQAMSYANPQVTPLEWGQQHTKLPSAYFTWLQKTPRSVCAHTPPHEPRINRHYVCP